MKNLQNEQYEYEKFMVELAHKINEIKQDFDKLSIKNKSKVQCELKNVLAAQGLTNIIKYINTPN